MFDDVDIRGWVVLVAFFSLALWIGLRAERAEN